MHDLDKHVFMWVNYFIYMESTASEVMKFYQSLKPLQYIYITLL